MSQYAFQSSKLFEGFSTVFRQWRADTTHCKYLHGYAVSFRLWFAGDLDHRNWVWDFGGMVRAKNKIDGMTPREWMNYMFDHTMIVAEDDPYLNVLQKMDTDGVAQVRVVPAVGAERFAQFLYEKLNPFVLLETNNRVQIVKVEFKEQDRNSAIYQPAQH